MAPQLTYGHPVDLGADVPILPPFACLCALLCAFPLSKVLGRRRWLPDNYSGPDGRAAFAGICLAMTMRTIVVGAEALALAGSGVEFTAVRGLATGGPYGLTRNPFYAGLVFVVMPGAAVTFDSLLPLAMALPLFLYFDAVVVPAEETLLMSAFPDDFSAYASHVPRWLVAPSSMSKWLPAL